MIRAATTRRCSSVVEAVRASTDRCIVNIQRFCAPHRPILTSRHGILYCLFSTNALTHSNPCPPAVVFDCSPACGVIPRLTPFSAMLARDPPVPLMAVAARAAPSIKVSENEALPFKKAVSVSLLARVLVHLGSNQSALKSNREIIRTKSRTEQYTQGRWRA